MSTVSSGFGNNNQQITNYNVAKIFIRDNRYESDQELNNSTYNPLVLLTGTAMGRVTATGNVAPLNSAASDGSQQFIGVLAQDVSLAAGASTQVMICVQGDIASEQLIFKYSGDGLETVVGTKRMKDHIQAQGIKLVPGFELTNLDNQ